MGRKFRRPPWVALQVFLFTATIICALFGFIWDVSLHIGNGRDSGPLANPAHYFILVGLFLLFIAGTLAMVLPYDKPGAAALQITRTWYVPVGGLLMAAVRPVRADRFPARRHLAPHLRSGRDALGPNASDADRRRRPVADRGAAAGVRGQAGDGARRSAGHPVRQVPAVSVVRRAVHRAVGFPDRVRLRGRAVPAGAAADDDRRCRGDGGRRGAPGAGAGCRDRGRAAGHRVCAARSRSSSARFWAHRSVGSRCTSAPRWWWSCSR